MPIDLQASTSSTSSICKQNSQEDSPQYSLDKSREETSLSRELYLTNLTNGVNKLFINNVKYCCTPKNINCMYEDEAHNADRSNYEKCKVYCSNPNCDQSGWIHVSCVKLWEKRIRSDIACLNPQLRAYIERQALATSVGTPSGSSGSSSMDPSHSGATSWMELLQTVLPASCLCRCNLGNLTRLEHTGNSNCGNPSEPGSAQHYSNALPASRRKLAPSSSNTQSGPAANFPLNPSTGSRKNSIEMVAGSSFNSFNKRMRSRTLSANQMLVEQSLAGMYLGPLDYSGAPPTAVVGKKETVKHSGGPKVGGGQSSGGQPPGRTRTHNRQRHHSSCYHGGAGTTNTGLKDELSVNGITPNSSGNIFKHRAEFRTFQKLPFSKQNAYFIQMEDDSCTGNDDTKVYLLTHLSQAGRRQVDCLVCGLRMPVYDHLPLIDGTFFLSPKCHSAARSIPIPAGSSPPGTVPLSSSASSSGDSSKYLHALCVHCMHEIVVCCQNCHRPWTGAQLLVGSLYTYDVFAAVPCCASRLVCNKCHRVCVRPGTVPAASSTAVTGDKPGIVSATSPTLVSLLSNFSQLSRSIECIHCHARDFHFVKHFTDVYKPIGTPG